jgi:hypothetical protein
LACFFIDLKEVFDTFWDDLVIVADVRLAMLSPQRRSTSASPVFCFGAAAGPLSVLQPLAPVFACPVRKIPMIPTALPSPVGMTSSPHCFT